MTVLNSNRMTKCFAVLIAISCLVNATCALAEDDQIYLKRGGGVGGEIKGTTVAKVAIATKGQNQTVNVNEIRLVTFADEPQELRQGRARATGGKFEDALSLLKRVNPAGVERDIVKRDLQFYLAYCAGKLALSSGGDKAKANDSMMAFVRAAPKSHHFFSAAELLGDLAVGQGDYASAVKFYSAIASKAPWPDYKMRASLAESRALVAQGKYAEAEAKFETIAGAPGDTPEANRQKLLAQAGKARCMAETGSVEDAIEMLETIIADNEPTDAELFGRTYNALGDCYQKADQPKEALMAYLHVDVLFYSEPEIHAEALFHLSNLWESTKKPDRAAASRTMLERRYGGSGWAKKN